MKIITITLFQMIISFSIFGQVSNTINDCGTKGSLTDYLKEIPSNNLRTLAAGPKMIKMYFHICRNDDGTNQAMTIEELQTEIQFTNSVYGGYAQICFAMVGFDYVNNTTLNTNSYAQTATFFDQFKEPDVFTVNVVASIPGGILGFAYVVSDWMVTKKDGFGPRRTFIHEMGHALGLEHTFRGYPSDPNGCRELVNGSNSSTCGDFLADTPADPAGLAGATSTACVYDGTARDANDQLFSPITTNYMSYWANSGCDRSTFTANQVGRMQTVIDNSPKLSSLLAPANITYVGLNISSGNIKKAAMNNIQIADETAGNQVLLNGTVKAYFTSPSTKLKPGFKASPDAGGIIKVRPSDCNF